MLYAAESRHQTRNRILSIGRGEKNNQDTPPAHDCQIAWWSAAAAESPDCAYTRPAWPGSSKNETSCVRALACSSQKVIKGDGPEEQGAA